MTDKVEESAARPWERAKLPEPSGYVCEGNNSDPYEDGCRGLEFWTHAYNLYWHDGQWRCHQCIFDMYYDRRAPDRYLEIESMLVTLADELDRREQLVILSEEVERRAGHNPPAGSDKLG